MPHDDELMDQLLKDAMAADAPQLSPGFDARVMRQVQSRRRLSSKGRAVLWTYAGVALALAIPVMARMPLVWIAASIGITTVAAVAVTIYGRRLAAALN